MSSPAVAESTAVPAASRILYASYEGQTVGELQADDTGSLSFRYVDTWLDAGFPISLSLPLAEAVYGDEAHRFFVNLLPEGVIRQLIARRLGISEDNDWALLEALGADCAGALALSPQRSGHGEASYQDLSLEELRTIASAPHPGLAGIGGEGSIRLSLAGAQDKLPVLVTESGDYQLPQGSAPSTHIIKFANPEFAHLTANEVFVTMLARRLGLPVVSTGLDDRFEPPLCIVERYDRVTDADGGVRRIHQEDFCQALGLPHTRKYEAEGGPVVGRIHAAIEANCADPIGDTQALVRWMAFCVLAGNADGHAKNLSLLYDGAAPRLAPFYDLVCTRVYEGINRRLAFSVAGESDPGQIARVHWMQLGEHIDARPAYIVELVEQMTNILPDALEETADGFRDTYGDAPILQMLPPVIRRQTRRTRDLLASPRR